MSQKFVINCVRLTIEALKKFLRNDQCVHLNHRQGMKNLLNTGNFRSLRKLGTTGFFGIINVVPVSQ